MIIRTKNLIEEVKTERELKSLAELNALRQQINAHFLYNTLDIIYWLSKNGNNEKAAEMTVSLSEMLRISVSNGREVISVKEEREHVEKYLTIQSQRFEFEYEIDIDEDILEYDVPKLILQPLAENAILHGFEDMELGGILRITGCREGDKLVFTVKDNGCGFVKGDELEGVEEAVKKGRYALKNLQMRFNLVYGKGEYIKFVTAPQKGTTVILTLPIM